MQVFMTGATKTLYMLLALALFSPVIASAQIVSTTESEADTGGNSAPSGGVVKTGSAGASVETTNVVGNSGGTVEVKVETTSNGQTQAEVIKKQVEGSVQVNVSAQSSSKGEGEEEKAGAQLFVSIGTSTPFWERLPFVSSFRIPSSTIWVKNEGVAGAKMEERFVFTHATSSVFADLRGWFRNFFSFLFGSEEPEEESSQ